VQENGALIAAVVLNKSLNSLGYFYFPATCLSRRFHCSSDMRDNPVVVERGYGKIV
jgi:hypothetical protein